MIGHIDELCQNDFKKLRRAKTIQYDVETGYRQTLVNSLIDKTCMLWYITDVKYMDTIIHEYIGDIPLYQCRRPICKPSKKCKMINQSEIEIRNIN